MIKATDYIKYLWRKEEYFKSHLKNQTHRIVQRENHKKSRRVIQFISYCIIGFCDYFKLILFFLILKFSKKPKVDLVFITKNFCIEENGRFEFRIAKEIFETAPIIINYSKELYLNRIGGTKVYNIGFFVRFISILFTYNTDLISRNYLGYSRVNNSILRYNILIDKIYYYCFYDLNSISIIFSKFRNVLNLVEIQHGSMINYPPYSEPAPIKIADIFYVRNLATIEYLKSHINQNFVCEYRLLHYPEKAKVIKPGLSVLYASTLELNGFHPVFREFIKSSNSANFGIINLSIRMHPREKGKEHLFVEDLEGCNVNYWFDNSDNWLNSNAIQNLIVVSPWSSIIEEACDNNFTCVIIDEIGRNRFDYLIDSYNCYYTGDLDRTLRLIRTKCEKEKG